MDLQQRVFEPHNCLFDENGAKADYFCSNMPTHQLNILCSQLRLFTTTVYLGAKLNAWFFPILGME